MPSYHGANWKRQQLWIQGDLLRGIDILSAEAYKKLNSPFDDCFVGSDFDPYGVSNIYNIKTLFNYAIINK